MINNGYKRLRYGVFAVLAYEIHFYSSEPASRLPQQGFFLMIMCLPGIAFAGLILALVSLVIGWVVYELRKRKVESEKAKSQAIVAAMLSLVLLVVVGCALVSSFFRDMYIP